MVAAQRLPPPKDIEARLDAAALACLGEGARLTELRRFVLALILQAENPLTAYQLLDRLRAVRRGAAPPTIYRTLDFLLGHKLIHRVESLNAFVPCGEPGHPHANPVQFLICRTCGTVAEVEDTEVAQALQHAAARQGFSPGTTVLEVQGQCADCAENEGAAPAVRR